MTVDEAVHAVQSVYNGRIDVVRGYSARSPEPISIVIGRRKKHQTACVWLPGMVWNPATGPMGHGEWLREAVPVAVIRPVPHASDVQPKPTPKRKAPTTKHRPDPREEFNRLFK